MSHESGWRGRVGRLVPAAYWRRAIDISDKKTPATATPIAELRRSQAEVVGHSLGPNFQIQWNEGTAQVHLDASDSQKICSELEAKGFLLVPIARDALSPGVLAGWSCAARSQVGRRSDLVEAIGVRLLALSGGLPPVAKNILEFSDPIDVVYTWVDGTDEAWQMRRRRAEAELSGELPPTANDQARYLSHDELRYSLRSVESFLPWVNHIYVVTAGQRPVWLNEGNPKISVVDHEEIFEDAGALPTFNSHAIESQLHRIPNLSEHFIYVNDDVFFGRALAQHAFYTPTGFPKFAISNGRFNAGETENLPVNVAAQNNNRILEATFGKTSAHKFKHVAHAQLKSTLATIAEQHPVETGMTASAKFRSETDLSIPSALAHYYGCALGAAFPYEVDYRYVDLGSERVNLKLARLFLQKRPQMFCINEVSTGRRGHAERTSIVQHTLQRMYPWPSSFEVAQYQQKASNDF